MARLWIIMHHDLQTSPEARKIARLTGESVFATIGRLHAVWCWADTHSDDGVVAAELEDIDDTAECDGFAEAMIAVGWLTKTDDGLEFPRFGDHNGKTAKSRAKAFQRQQRSRRASANESVTHDRDKTVEPVTQDRDHTSHNNTEQDNAKAPTRETGGEARASRGGPSPEMFDWSRSPERMRTPKVREALIEWYRYRSGSKLKRWQSVTLLKTLNKFDKMGGPDALIEAIDHSIAQGYQGLVPPKRGGTATKPADRVHNRNTTGGGADADLVRLKLTGESA